MESVKEKIAPQIIGTAVKNCSGKLPDIITMSTLDWSSNPELTNFNACTEKKIAEKANVSLTKFQQCSSQEEDWQLGLVDKTQHYFKRALRGIFKKHL